MHSFEMTRILCFVLKDVKNLILAIGTDYDSQMKLYSKLPFVTMDFWIFEEQDLSQVGLDNRQQGRAASAVHREPPISKWEV